MNKVIIKTQQDWDNLPAKFKTFTYVEIRANELITIKKCPDSSQVTAYNSSQVAAYNSSQVRACDSSQVTAYNSSQVRAYNSSQVTAYNSSQVRAYNSSQVTAYNSSQVAACDSSQVTAYNSSQVTAYNSSQVRAYNSSQVAACDSSQVTAYNSSQVTAYNSSQVTAYNSSQVRACDSSQVEAYNSSQVTAYNSSQVTAYNSSQVRACDSSQVEAYEKAVIRVLSNSVKINSLLDYSTAIIENCNPGIIKQDNTALIRHIPSDLNISFDTWLDRGVVRADGIYKQLVSKKTLNGIDIFEVKEFFNSDKNSYVVRRGNTFSHGETINKAIEDLRYKLQDRDLSEFNSWKNDVNLELTLDEAIQGYRTITGACELGTKQFVTSSNIPDKLTPKLILKLTKGQYGNEILAKFLEESRQVID
jgi:hypothetical protein